ncbi:hypothetical protein [Vibrio phage vB_VibM_10AMN]|uniref:Putative phage tail fibre N-terminal domain-containing protein n=1 Tax=Staphylococcus phage vB_VibM_10AMN12 TaxID=3076785 RepID=A0AA96KSW7_9CAUD|nr:hypothetical protein [Vibrio phage vB_VibM_10AMN]WNO47458.1 hypothetical protein [Staphylococcus phage vB_VibM_10AMN12]
MSTFPATNSNEAVELIIDGGNQLHQIINEDATTEVQTESGPIPSVRKALADTFLFLEPIAWQNGSDEIAFNQLRTFDDNIYWAPTASLSNPIPMGVTPVGDSNWHPAPVNTSVYKGLWPDMGGSALNGQTWQTQVGGVPTGYYYTALRNTNITPTGDNVNWRPINNYGPLSEDGLTVSHRSGNNSEIMSNTPALAELWINLEDNSIHVGDGVKQGGFKHLNTENAYLVGSLSFNSVAEMISKSVNIPLGKQVSTRGYYDAFDGGGAEYDITTAGTPDNLTVFDLGNGLNAKLRVPREGLKLEQCGALGDSNGTVGNGNDDTKAIQAALNLSDRVIGRKGKHYRTTHTVFYRSGLILDGGFAQFFFDGAGDGSAFMPITYQEANSTNWTESCVFKNMIVSTAPNLGNFFATAKGRRIWFEKIISNFVYWHVVDAAGGKSITIKDCISLATRSAAFQMDVLNDSTAVWAVDENGLKLNTAFSSGGEFWTYATDMLVDSCYVLGDGSTSTNVGVNMHRDLCAGLKVTRCTFVNLAGFGVHLDEGSMANVIVTNNQFTNCNRCLDSRADIDDLIFDSNICKSTVTPYYAVYVVPTNKVTPIDKVKVTNNTFTKYRTVVRCDYVDNVTVDGNIFERSSGVMATGTVTPSMASDYCISLDNCAQYTVNNNTFNDCEVSACIKIVMDGQGYIIGGAVTGNSSRNSAQFLTGEWQENISVTANSIDGAASGAITAIYLENGRGNGIHSNTVKQELTSSDSIVMHNEIDFSIDGGSLYCNSSQGNGILLTGNSTGKVGNMNIRGLTGGAGFYVYASDNSSVDVFAPYAPSKLKKDAGASLSYSDITTVSL